MQIAGFATDLGGATSHTAIVARGMSIPAVVGMHHVRQLVQDDDMVIIDGTRGVVIVDPDKRVLDEYRLRKTELELERNKLKRLKTTRSETLDGEAISLQANIEQPGDVAQARDVDAAGIGLYRTEFLFLGRDELPDEDEQFEAYRSVVQAMRGRPVTIRTLDVGADKALRGVARIEANPALGLRAIRYCLAEPKLFLMQLRAILRASHYGTIRLLIPMLSHAHEIDQVAGDDRNGQGAVARIAASLRRRHRSRRHDRDSGRRPVARRVRQAARLPLDRHQRPDPVHAGDRPHRRGGRPPLRPDASGGACG